MRSAGDDLPELPAAITGESDEHRANEMDTELSGAALRALWTLPSPQREAVVLTKLEGKSVAEAAEIAGTTVGAMKLRAHRGLRSPAQASRPHPGVPMTTTTTTTTACAPPPISAALEAELSRLAPVAPRRPGVQLVVLAVASLVYGGVALALLGLRADFHELPPTWLVAAGFTWWCGFAVPAYFALVPAAHRGNRRSPSMAPRWPAATVAAIVAPIALISSGLAVAPRGPHSLYFGLNNLLHGHACLWIGLAVALVPVVFGARFLRGALPYRSRHIAAALGAAGGALGGLLLHLHCRVADGYHVGLLHGGAVAVAAAIAAAVVPKVSDQPFRVTWASTVDVTWRLVGGTSSYAALRRKDL